MPASDFDFANELTTFAGADEDPLSEGGRFLKLNTAATGDLEIVSNAVTANDNIFGAEYWTPDTFGPDIVCHSEIASAAGVNYVLSVRVNSPGGLNTWTGYNIVYAGATSNWAIIRIDGDPSGVGVLLGAAAGVALAAGDRIGALAVRSTIEAWYYRAGAWTLALSVSDSTWQTSGYVSLGKAFTAGSLGDLWAGTVISTTHLLASTGVGT